MFLAGGKKDRLLYEHEFSSRVYHHEPPKVVMKFNPSIDSLNSQQNSRGLFEERLMYKIQQFPSHVELTRETPSGEIVIQFYSLESFSFFIRISPIVIKKQVIEQMLPAILSFKELDEARRVVVPFFQERS